MSFATPSVAGFDFVKPPQYVEEATYGIMPTASPVFTLFDICQAWRPAIELSKEDFPRVGIEDIYKILKIGEVHRSVLDVGIINSTQLKYLISARGGGVGTIDKSLSLIASVRIDGVENFIKMVGTRIDSGTLTIERGVIKVVYNLIHKEIQTPGIAHGLTTPTFAAAPTADPLTHLDGGANPMLWNAVAQKIKRASYTFNRNLAPQQLSGDALISFLNSTNRRVTFDFERIWEGTTLEADLKAGTARALSQVIKSAVSTLSITNAKLTTLARDKDVRTNEIITETFGGTAESFSIT